MKRTKFLISSWICYSRRHTHIFLRLPDLTYFFEKCSIYIFLLLAKSWISLFSKKRPRAKVFLLLQGWVYFWKKNMVTDHSKNMSFKSIFQLLKNILFYGQLFASVCWFIVACVSVEIFEGFSIGEQARFNFCGFRDFY